MSERIAILGAGIIGCLIAREVLTAAPGSRITVIDRDLAGCGASLRSAGVHFPVGRTPRVRAMAALSQDYYRDLAIGRPDLPIRPLDLHAVSSREHADALRAIFVAPGEARRPSAGELADLVTWPEESAVWRVPGSHCADVGTLVQHLLHGLRGAVTLLEGTGVDAVRETGDGVAVSLANGETLVVDRLALAPGPWVNAHPWAALTEPLGARVKKVVALHLDHPVTDGAAAVMFPHEDAFIVPLPHRGHWLFSYTCLEWDVSPDALPRGLSERNLREARAILRRYAPDLAPGLRAGRVFCDAYSPTREPLVTTVGDSGAIVFAGAANGSGYRLAPAIAIEAARLLA